MCMSENMKKVIPKCYIYGLEKTKICRQCRKPLKLVQILYSKEDIGTSKSYSARYCENCDVYYIKYSVYMAHRYEKWDIQNKDALPKYQNQFAIFDFDKSQEKRKDTEEDMLKREKERKFQDFLKRRQERIEREKQEVENNISIQDFVIRRSTFKCLHDKHQLKNIEGIISVVNSDGCIEKHVIPAGYCSECNLYFIMESTYEKIRDVGTPLCRLTDEKNYLQSNTNLKGLNLAKESVLMQYGYNVSQEEGLSEKKRRTILASLIDNNILTKNDVISYLDFFINQKKSRSQYEKAIEKWENDRDFIFSYKRGTYAMYGIGGISNAKSLTKDREIDRS